MRRFKERSKSFPDPSVFFGVHDDPQSPNEVQTSKVNPSSQSYSWEPPRSKTMTGQELKRPATTPNVLRRRALSEHGKSLMMQAYTDPALALPQKKVARTKPKKRRTRNGKAKSKKSEKIAANVKGMNYFQVLSQFHENKAMKDIRKHKTRRSSAMNGLSPATPITEDVLAGEDGWQTVKSKPRRPVRRQSSQRVVNATPEPVIEEYGDISELQYLEEDAAGSRVWGKHRKAHGFKAAKQRNYAIAKRAAQRAGR